MLRGLDTTTRTLEIGGVDTALIEIGDGRPLLLLHGATECGGAMWAPVLAALARNRRVVIPDFPGLGESAPLPQLTVDSFADWMTDLIERTGLARPMVVGHSMLGSLALHFAARSADTMERLVVYGAPAVGPYRIPLRLAYLATRFGMRPTAANAERFDRFMLLDRDATRGRDPAWYDAFDAYTRACAGRPEAKKTMGRLVKIGKKAVPDDDMARIAVPVALVWGRHDRVVPLRAAEAAARKHQWPLHVIEHAAHAPHIEQPGSFVEAIAEIDAVS